MNTLNQLFNNLEKAKKYTDIDIEEVKILLSAEDDLMRSDVVEILYDYIDETEIQEILFDSLNDRRYIVRCDVYDCIGDMKKRAALLKLLERLPYEKNKLAKMYLISAICRLEKFIQEEDKDIIHRYCNHKKQGYNGLKIACLSLKYIMEKDLSLIYDILEFLNDKDYHIRHNVINFTDIILDENNEHIVLEYYRNYKAIEEADSVKERIEKEIIYMESGEK